MPKQVDHDERRRHIAAAVARIAAAEGLEAVSMRRVATEAGISTPLVQHYFADKDAMLRFALTDVTATARRRSEQRIRERLGAGPVDDPAQDGEPLDLAALLRAILDELLPLDPERTELLRLLLAFFARATRDPELASFYRDTLPGDPGPLTDLLRAEQAAGRAPAGLDPAAEIDSLMTLGVGLGTDMLLGTRTPEAARELIDYHVRRLLPGP